MAELQRSVTSFRRQGSSGSVWDDKFLAGLWDQTQNQNLNDQGTDNKVDDDSKKHQVQENERGHKEFQKVGIGSSSTATDAAPLQRSRSTGTRPYRTVNVAPPLKDPPSPKVAICGFFGCFGNSASAATKKSSNNPKSKKSR